MLQALKTDPSSVKPDDKSLTFRIQQSELCHIYAIGGWVTTGVGQKYGAGHSLEVKTKWIVKLVPV